jgi:hypothetical protein
MTPVPIVQYWSRPTRLALRRCQPFAECQPNETTATRLASDKAVKHSSSSVNNELIVCAQMQCSLLIHFKRYDDG